MNESVLRDFFTGEALLEQLAEDLCDALVNERSCVTKHPIVDMHQDFSVTSAHLAKVCDGFLEGVLTNDDLRAIGFCLIASDRFEWDADTTDGSRVADVTLDWSSPEIYFPIDAENAAKWKKYLQTGEDRLRSEGT